MIYRSLGKHGPVVSLIGYGGWALGEEGWPDVESREACRALEKAFEQGITFYDTAPFYGKGLSETRIGEILHSVRSEIVIATKCGIHWDDHRIWLSLARDDILREVEASLKRLRTDTIDLYQVHWYDHKTPLREVFSTLHELKKQGVIRHIGVCNMSVEFIQKARRWAEITSVQSLYNILQRDAETTLLPWCQEEQVGFIAYSVLAQGMLANRFFSPHQKTKDVRKHNPLYKNPPSSLPSLEEALGFVVKNLAVSCALVSMTKAYHVEQNCKIIEEMGHSEGLKIEER